LHRNFANENDAYCLAGAALFRAGYSALERPDWHMIEHGRKRAADRWEQVQAQQNAERQRKSDEADIKTGTGKNYFDTNKKSE
jgi:hypothetical protein